MSNADAKPVILQDEWLFAEQIAEHEGIKPRQARRKYLARARACGGADKFCARLVPSNGGYKRQFNLSILDEATRETYLATARGAAPESPAETVSAPGALERITPSPTSIVRSEALSQLLPLEFENEAAGTSAVPKSKLPWARARRRIIASLIPNNDGEAQWESWRGQNVHGIAIRTKEDFVLALAKDSKALQPLLLDWNGITQELREATKKPRAHVSPISARTIWRLYGWYTAGRPLLRCARCGGDVDQHSGNCERCGTRQWVSPGLEALQDFERSDKDRIKLKPEHARYLTAALLGGDESVERRKLALERRRSAAECLELIRLEVASGNLPGPAPSYYKVTRLARQFLPRVMRDHARLGEKRALARRGPYIPRSHAGLQVNDIRFWDFRRLNVRTWIEADGRLYRPFLCAGLDAASRDVVFNFDLYPSAQLFKSTLRMALLKWGTAREEWCDNGREFSCEEVAGRDFRAWTERFEIDDECTSIFDKLGSTLHYCLVENPTGKADLERFFQTFDRFERTFPGSTGEKAGNRPQRLKEEEREHMEFCAGARARTPLLRFDVLFQLLQEMIEFRYRHRKHTGDSMYRRTPAQVQAAFLGERRIPRAEELDILLWHRKTVTARGDKVAFLYHGRSLIFRSEQLLALPGDGSVEVHLDPINADRALAFANGRVIVLQPVNPTGGQSTAQVKDEIQRKRKLEKAIRRATLAGSVLVPVASPARVLAMAKVQADAKNAALDAERRDVRREVSIPAYAKAASVVRNAAPQHGEISSSEWIMRHGQPDEIPDPAEEPVFTSRVEAEEWQKAKQKGLS
jgi:hypothetical protein